MGYNKQRNKKKKKKRISVLSGRIVFTEAIIYTRGEGGREREREGGGREGRRERERERERGGEMGMERDGGGGGGVREKEENRQAWKVGSKRTLAQQKTIGSSLHSAVCKTR